MTPDDLAAYRARVSKAWSPATAHPGFAGADQSPVGQCGVTSAWLQKQLAGDHRLRAWLQNGVVRVHGELFINHCWLEVDGVVVDLTADQFGLPEVVYGAPNGVCYMGTPGMAPVARLALLEAAL